MYENCTRQFFKHHQVEVLQYMARAYFRAGKLKDAKKMLLKARRVAPHDTVILYNIALILQRLAMQILKEEKAELSTVVQAVNELGLSQKYFQYLSVHGDRLSYDVNLAGQEARQCQDLLSQAQYHVERARRLDEVEQQIRRRQEEDRRNFKLRQAEEEKRRKEDKVRQLEEEIKKRQEYKEKTKGALVFDHFPSEKKSRGGGRGRKGDYVSDSDSDGSGPRPEGGGEPRERKKKSEGRKKSNKRRPRSGSDGGSGSDRPARKKGRKFKDPKQKKQKAKDDGLSTKQKLRIVSKGPPFPPRNPTVIVTKVGNYASPHPVVEVDPEVDQGPDLEAVPEVEADLEVGLGPGLRVEAGVRAVLVVEAVQGQAVTGVNGPGVVLRGGVAVQDREAGQDLAGHGVVPEVVALVPDPEEDQVPALDPAVGLIECPALNLVVSLIECPALDPAVSLIECPALDPAVSLIECPALDPVVGLVECPALDPAVGLIECPAKARDIGNEVTRGKICWDDNLNTMQAILLTIFSSIVLKMSFTPRIYEEKRWLLKFNNRD
ncbi:hypothetical protein WDU94_006935 [Cyamophila willieti]